MVNGNMLKAYSYMLSLCTSPVCHAAERDMCGKVENMIDVVCVCE